MPEFDPNNPKGPAGAALYATATLLSGLSLFQELCEVSTSAKALAKIAVGIQKDPANGDTFDLEELKNEFVQANIYPVIPSQSVVMPGDGSPTPVTGGQFTLFIRRHVRESEVSDHELRNGLFLWFHDMVTAIYRALLTAAEATSCPRLRGIVPEIDGAFNERSETSAQGEYLWARFGVLWGDEVES